MFAEAGSGKPVKQKRFSMWFRASKLPATVSKEVVAKGTKALNHEGHKGKEKLFFVLFVSFVVPFFSEPFATPSKEAIAKGFFSTTARSCCAALLCRILPKPTVTSACLSGCFHPRGDVTQYDRNEEFDYDAVQWLRRCSTAQPRDSTLL